MTDFQQPLGQPVAFQAAETTADSQPVSKGLDQYIADRYMDLMSRVVVVRWTWKRTHLGLFAVAATGRQASNQGIAIYLVEDGKIVACQLTADECQEFHDLMEMNQTQNRSPRHLLWD